MIQHTLESLSGLSDGTYTIYIDGSVHDVSRMYLDGYFVGTGPLTDDWIKPGVMFGVWIDPTSDPFSATREIDLVTWEPDLDEAIYWGQYYNQKAIWDIENQQEIYLTND
jgi:hypothetical protein